MRRILRTWEGRIGLFLVVGTTILIAVGPYIAPYSPTEVGLDQFNQSPNSVHWLGTDHLGRDVLSRFLSGGRSIIFIPVVSVTLAYLTAGLVSMVAAYKGGIFDLVVSRIVELLMSLPSLLKILLMVAAFGPSTGVLILAITIANMSGASRVVRGAVLSQSRLDYVKSSEARGEGVLIIVVQEILPNIVGPLAADYTLRITWAIIALSTLSFLGLGVQPPQPDWGLMIQDARASIKAAPLVAIVPALGIAALSVGLNLTADAIVRWSEGKEGST